MMTAVVIDDDFLNIELIEVFCKRYAPIVEIIGTAETVEEGLEEVINKKPDILFLDIEIHNQTGFEIISTVELDELMVIVITAHEKYALQALKLKVTDYILKPVAIKEFVRAVGNCKLEFDRRKAASLSVKDNMSINGDTKFLSIPYKEHIEIIPLDDILHLEADNVYTIITTMNNVKHTSSKSLKEYEDKLNNTSFIRTHSSHIININGISRLMKNRNGSLLLKNGVEVPISLMRRKEVMERLL